MTDKVLKTVSKHHMVSAGETVGIGLSGGADSVALTHILSENKDVLGIKSIKAIHIHHGIRGKEADRDMEFSQNLCEKLNIEFLCFKADVPAEARKTGESLEECARRIRYSFFAECGCDKIATAHNLNDNMETFLLNLTRGTSLSGLCSIPYTRDIYIRPLLDCTRAEIERYNRENGLSFVTDSTNLCDDYSRNKIRHNILPRLFEINPSFDKSFQRCLDSVYLAEDYFTETARDLLNSARSGEDYDCSVFENSHNALKYRVISMILKEKNAKNINRKHIESVAAVIKTGGSVDINGGLTVTVERKMLSFGKTKATDYFEFPTDIKSGIIETPVGIYAVNTHFKKDLQNLNKETVDNFIDCDKITGVLYFRNRREGDKYRQAGRGVTKTLKDLFNESKTPVCERSKMLILSDDSGIVWTEFFGVSQRCKVTDKTEKYIKIEKTGE